MGHCGRFGSVGGAHARRYVVVRLDRVPRQMGPMEKQAMIEFAAKIYVIERVVAIAILGLAILVAAVYWGIVLWGYWRNR